MDQLVLLTCGGGSIRPSTGASFSLNFNPNSAMRESLLYLLTSIACRTQQRVTACSDDILSKSTKLACFFGCYVNFIWFEQFIHDSGAHCICRNTSMREFSNTRTTSLELTFSQMFWRSRGDCLQAAIWACLCPLDRDLVYRCPAIILHSCRKTSRGNLTSIYLQGII